MSKVTHGIKREEVVESIDHLKSLLTEQGQGGMIKSKKLLRVTKNKKLWRTMIIYLMIFS